MSLVSPLEENFNVILVRYSEVALKSPKVRSRMENRLVSHIKQLCARENIPIVKAERNWGRLLFFFASADIANALRLFPYVIGVHSFSAGLSLDTSYDTIKPIALEFARLYFQAGDKFAFRARRVKPYPKTTLEIEHDIGGEISTQFEEKGQDLTVDLRHPDKTLYLEIRRDIAFLYTEERYTIWGGNPIEHDKAMFALDFGQEGDLVAMQLLLRRGTVLFPLAFQSAFAHSLKADSIEEVLHARYQKLALFYPSPMKIAIFDDGPVSEVVLQKIGEITAHPDPNIVKWMVPFLLAAHYFQTNAQVNGSLYQNRRILVKGVISGIDDPNLPVLPLIQMLGFPHFLPIVGLGPTAIHHLYQRLAGDEKIDLGSDFSIAISYLSHQPGKCESMGFESASSINKEVAEIWETVAQNLAVEEAVKKAVTEGHLIDIGGKIL